MHLNTSVFFFIALINELITYQSFMVNNDGKVNMHKWFYIHFNIEAIAWGQCHQK